MKQNFTRKQVIINFFSVTGMTGQNQHNWPDFFCQGTFFEVLGKGVARGSGQNVASHVFSDLWFKMLFQIFRLNFS